MWDCVCPLDAGQVGRVHPGGVGEVFDREAMDLGQVADPLPQARAGRTGARIAMSPSSSTWRTHRDAHTCSLLTQMTPSASSASSASPIANGSTSLSTHCPHRRKLR
jgi:hypothetical protein